MLILHLNFKMKSQQLLKIAKDFGGLFTIYDSEKIKINIKNSN